MNIRDFWSALTSLNLRSAVLPSMPPRSAETPQFFLERQQVRCDRHSWLADFSVTGPAWTCSTCGCSVPAASEMTVTRP